MNKKLYFEDTAERYIDVHSYGPGDGTGGGSSGPCMWLGSNIKS